MGAGAAESSERSATRIIRQVPDWIWAASLLAALVALGLVLLALREARRRRRAERDVLFDPLTGVASRQGLERRLAYEWERAVRYERQLGMLVLDLDGFKQINDSLGHAAGDELLRKVAGAIAAQVRLADFVARTGGDEFVVLAPETSGAGLTCLAGLLAEATAGLPVGISVGWAEREAADESASQALHRADLAMYEAKERRRSPAARGAAPAPVATAAR